MFPLIAMLIGLICAGGGGELFVRGTVGLAAAARVSPAVIAATVAAFATSSPELTIAVSSALAGEPEISLGDALGSNVVNIALILGLALLFGPLEAERGKCRRDYFVSLATPVLLGLMLADGVVGRLDALLLLTAFALWLAAVVRDARRERIWAPTAGKGSLLRPGVESLVGLALLIAAGKLIVYGAGEMARQMGMSEFIVGATIVAVGTSTPELATTLISRLRGQDEVGLGALLGSNIFNSLFIIGVAGAITPIAAAIHAVASALFFGLLALALAYPDRTGVISRWRGLALLASYAVYLAVIAGR